MSIIAVGDKAPDFKLPSHRTQDLVSLSDYAGKPIVLFFYPKDLTPDCTREACSFRDHYVRLNTVKQLDIMGINGDSLVLHSRFAKEHQLPFHLLSDRDYAVAKRYGAFGSVWIRGKELPSVLRKTFIVDTDFRISYICEESDIERHVEETIAALHQVVN